MENDLQSSSSRKTRKISWRLYATALAISIIVFAAGVFIGIQLAQSASQTLQSELDGLRTRTTEIQLLSLLDENSSSQLCGFYSAQISEFDNITSDFGAKLDYLEKTRGRTDPGVQSLKREFLLMQFRDFLFIQKVSRQCPAMQINTVLYFYTNQNCSECTRQGLVGPPLKQIAPDKIMIYAFDADLNSPAVNALQQMYGVSSYPALVINGKKFEGYVSLDRIESELKLH